MPDPTAFFAGIDINQILDVLTILSVIGCFIWVLENLFIFFFSWDVTKLWVQMALFKQPGFIRWTGESWLFHLAWVDPENPKNWILKLGGKDIPYEKIAGSVGIGPGKCALMLISDENSGAAGVSLNRLLAGQAIGATPAHVSSIEKAAYAEGYTEGFEKTHPEGAFEWVKENMGTVIIVMMLVLVGTLVLYDKVISSPAAWSAANQCEQQKAILLGKLGQCGGDISSIAGYPTAGSTTTTTLQASATGTVVH